MTQGVGRDRGPAFSIARAARNTACPTDRVTSDDLPRPAGRLSTWRPWAVAIAASIAAIALRAALAPVLHDSAPLILLLTAPLVAALYGGLGPGLLATALCAVGGGALFVRPFVEGTSPPPAELLRLAIFVTEGVLFSWLVDSRNRVLEALRSERASLVAAESDLAGRERRLRRILEASPSAMVVADAEGRIVSTNRQADRSFGYQGEEWSRLRVEDLVPDELRAVHEAHRQDFGAHRTARAMGLGRDLLARRRDGTTFPVEVGLNPLDDDEPMVLASVVDITARKAAERELRRSELQFRRLFDAAPIAYLLVEPGSLRLFAANAEAARLLGEPVEALAGRTVDALDTGLTAQDWHAAATQAAAGRPLQQEVEFGRAGTRAGREVLLFVQSLQPGDEPLLLVAALDIHDRKHMENELRLASRQKDDFLAMLAHELRNPLSPLTMGLTLLRRSPALGPQDHRVIDMLERQTRQLTHRVNDLLEVARIQRGKVTLVRETVVLQDVARHAVDAIRASLAQKQQTFSQHFARTPVHVLADTARIQQVLENLLTNASKYTPVGGHVALRVGADGDEARCCVEDDGVGLDPQDLPRVFSLFAQAGATIDRSQGGLGLGLALVKQLVELHGGRVGATSAGRGCGATFCVWLPRVQPPAPAAMAPAPVVDPVGSPAADESLPAVGTRPRSVPRRALVVDDNRDAADTLAELLQAEGHVVQRAYDGPSALQLASRFRPDVAFLDIGLPGLDGYALARALRAEPALRRREDRPPVLVAVTGYGQTADRAAAREAGFDRHLLKPVAPRSVLDVLEGLDAEPRADLGTEAAGR